MRANKRKRHKGRKSGEADMKRARAHRSKRKGFEFAAAASVTRLHGSPLYVLDNLAQSGCDLLAPSSPQYLSPCPLSHCLKSSSGSHSNAIECSQVEGVFLMKQQAISASLCAGRCPFDSFPQVHLKTRAPLWRLVLFALFSCLSHHLYFPI